MRLNSVHDHRNKRRLPGLSTRCSFCWCTSCTRVLVGAVVPLLHLVDVVNGGRRLDYGSLGFDDDRSGAVVRALVLIGGTTGLGLARDVEFPVRCPHVRVWDSSHPLRDYIRNLVWLNPRLLALEIHVAVAPDHVGVKLQLDTGGFAGEVARVKDEPA